MKQLVIANRKGGVGKSTLTLILAPQFQQEGHTLVIDADRNQTCVKWAKRAPDQHEFQVFSLKKASAAQTSGFEYRLLDTEAGPSDEDLEELIEIADLILLPCSPDAFALEPTIATAQALAALGSEKHFAVLNNVPTHARSTDEAGARALLEDKGIPTLSSRIRQYSAYKEAALLGWTIDQVKHEKAWEDSQAVFSEVFKLLGKF